MSFGLQGPESLIGRVIADYELTSFLGTGATGLVFRGKRVAGAPTVVEKTGAFPVTFPEDAAIKLLVLPLGTKPEEQADFQRRFEREADVLRQLAHPHIVPFIDSGKDAGSGFYYMVLEYMAGGSLATTIAQRGPLSLAEVAATLTPIAEALDFAHSQGVVHRDVKPGNILLDGQGAPYLGDFGIVRLLSDTSSQRTTTGRMMGTPSYMAPEQFSDTRKAGPPSDIYGLGMVVYEMVTGRVAFETTDWVSMMSKHVNEAPASPHTVRPDLPYPAAAAILRALEKDPARRFPTAAAFAEAFALGVQNLPWGGMTAYIAPAAPARPVTPDLPAANLAQTWPGMPAVGVQANAQASGDPWWRGQRGVVAVAAILLLVSCLAGMYYANASGAIPVSLNPLVALATSTITSTSASSNSGTQPSGALPTNTHAPGARPTATSTHSGGGGGGGGGGGAPTATPTNTKTPPTPTNTPLPPTPTNTPLPPTPTNTPVPPPSISIGWSSAHPTYVWVNYSHFSPGWYTYTCNFGSGGPASYSIDISSDPYYLDNGHTCCDGYKGDTLWITVNGHSSNVLTEPVNGTTCP